jgi:hypothetical protein
MKKIYQPAAEELAILVVIMIQRYAKERGRDVSQVRLARNSLRRLAIRNQLRDSLVDDWSDIMALEYGWLVFRQDEEFSLVKAKVTKTWVKIASKRCDDLIKRLRQGDASALGDAELEITRTPDIDEGDDEE